MTNKFLATVLFAAATLFATAASAETVRTPATGDPAVTITFPDGWQYKLDSGGSLISFPADHSSSITVTVTDYKGTLDDLAAGAMKIITNKVPVKLGPATISGYKGFVYGSDTTSAKGVHANVRLYLIQIDAGHVSGINYITIDGMSDAQTAAADGVMKSIAIIGGPPS